jgi:hypothetical protein
MRVILGAGIQAGSDGEGKEARAQYLPRSMADHLSRWLAADPLDTFSRRKRSSYDGDLRHSSYNIS